MRHLLLALTLLSGVVSPAAAQAPVPQAKVGPAPRSQTRTVALCGDVSAAASKFVRCGNSG